MQRDNASLLDMLLSARDARSVVEKITREQFQSSRIYQLASLKAIETIGETAYQVAEDTRRTLPEIPWDDIIGMRHRLVHAYFDINLDILWKMAQ